MTSTDRQTLFRQAAIAVHAALCAERYRDAENGSKIDPVGSAMLNAEQIVSALAERERLHQHDGDPGRDPDFQVAPASGEIQKAVDALTATRVSLGRADGPVPKAEPVDGSRMLDIPGQAEQWSQWSPTGNPLGEESLFWHVMRMDANGYMQYLRADSDNNNGLPWRKGTEFATTYYRRELAVADAKRIRPESGYVYGLEQHTITRTPV